MHACAIGTLLDTCALHTDNAFKTSGTHVMHMRAKKNRPQKTDIWRVFSFTLPVENYTQAWSDKYQIWAYLYFTKHCFLKSSHATLSLILPENLTLS